VRQRRGLDLPREKDFGVMSPTAIALPLALAATLADCGGIAEVQQNPPEATTFPCPGDAGVCPVGSTCLPSGGCWNAEATNSFEDAGCNAVACEALARAALSNGAGDCVEFCAAWCFSTCAADPQGIADDKAQMQAEGCDLTACRF
jgi:hypothetical protein